MAVVEMASRATIISRKARSKYANKLEALGCHLPCVACLGPESCCAPHPRSSQSRSSHRSTRRRSQDMHMRVPLSTRAVPTAARIQDAAHHKLPPGSKRGRQRGNGRIKSENVRLLCGFLIAEREAAELHCKGNEG